ncbi:hypothetical protein GY45DRAFT_304920 [Cubamyces sp. BRFM 1775]|nr:hypothetical protein GY45DRAFT_304920 [Cubamyces sp. BRFM 1775]
MQQQYCDIRLSKSFLVLGSCLALADVRQATRLLHTLTLGMRAVGSCRQDRAHLPSSESISAPVPPMHPSNVTAPATHVHLVSFVARPRPRLASTAEIAHSVARAMHPVRRAIPTRAQMPQRALDCCRLVRRATVIFVRSRRSGPSHRIARAATLLDRGTCVKFRRINRPPFVPAAADRIRSREEGQQRDMRTVVKL